MLLFQYFNVTRGNVYKIYCVMYKRSHHMEKILMLVGMSMTTNKDEAVVEELYIVLPFTKKNKHKAKSSVSSSPAYQNLSNVMDKNIQRKKHYK